MPRPDQYQDRDGARRAGRVSAGVLVSGGLHAAAVIGLLVNLGHAPNLETPPETVQVDLVSDASNDISMGEKTAKLAPVPARRVDKVADLEEHHALPPTPQASKDTPSLDAPDKPNDDPGPGDKAPVAALPPPAPTGSTPAVPTPPARPVEDIAAPTPPARPVETAKVEPATPAKSEARPEEKPDAEALAPKPPPRPKEAAKEEAKVETKVEPKPVPRPRPVKVAKVVPPKKPELKPEPVVPPVRPEPTPEKTSLFDKVASLLKEKPEPPAPKPRAGNETKDAHPTSDFNPDKIAAVLDHDAPQRRASTGRATIKLASLGLPNAHAEKLSPSMTAQIDNWLIDHYRGCWSYFGLGGSKDYVPLVVIKMAQDGTLIGQPALLNPPKDPNLRSLADSALRAVNRCNPMEIPARFKPFYDQGYKERTVRFDPKEMS